MRSANPEGRGGLDGALERFPIVGVLFRRAYAYYREHLFFADVIHVALGMGVAFLVVGPPWTWWGWILVSVSVLGHVWAVVRGQAEG